MSTYSSEGQRQMQSCGREQTLKKDQTSVNRSPDPMLSNPIPDPVATLTLT